MVFRGHDRPPKARRRSLGVGKTADKRKRLAQFRPLSVLGRGADRRQRLLGGCGSRCREGGRRGRRGVGRRPPRRLPAPSPLPERERVAALERCVDDLRHPVVVAITVTHGTKVRRAPDGLVWASEQRAGYWFRAARDCPTLRVTWNPQAEGSPNV